MPYRSRATERLLAGRVSVPGAAYFLTWCTQNRAPSLSLPDVQFALRDAIAGLGKTNDATLLAATIMPDHVHLLLTLGRRLTVSQLVAKVKVLASRGHPSVQWQLNFFEHRLREITAAEDFAFYIYMNPYMAGLCHLNETWPGWMPSTQARWSFEAKLREGRFPQAEWLTEAVRLARTLPAGAG